MVLCNSVFSGYRSSSVTAQMIEMCFLVKMSYSRNVLKCQLLLGLLRSSEMDSDKLQPFKLQKKP